MRRRIVWSSLVVFLLFLAGAPGLLRDAAGAESCITAQCHQGMLKTKHLHPVAESCDSCHQQSGASHPQKNKKTFRLVQDVPGLCGACHAPFTGKRVTHPPVKDGMCLTCHNPHDSDEPKLLIQPLKDVCLSCHSDKVNYPNVHGPVSTGDCTACHNPHASDTKALLLKDSSELCFVCHADLQEDLKKKNVHPALLGGCTSCHNPHGSPVKKFLSAEGKDLCFQCHPQLEEKIKNAAVVHAPIVSERACASCHSPHASENEKLLPKFGKELCLECHKTFMKKTWTVMHGPLREGKCTPCHDPHASKNEKLLAKSFPADFYAPYSDKEYELCFSCHNRDLLRYPDTSFATGFRDGEKNLHFLHVNREKGRNCKACHAIHGGTMPKLILDKSPFGKWELPLKFVKTETGGSCTPGCHQKFSYDRKTPGKEEKKPETEKKRGKGKL